MSEEYCKRWPLRNRETAHGPLWLLMVRSLRGAELLIWENNVVKLIDNTGSCTCYGKAIKSRSYSEGDRQITSSTFCYKFTVPRDVNYLVLPVVPLWPFISQCWNTVSQLKMLISRLPFGVWVPNGSLSDSFNTFCLRHS